MTIDIESLIDSRSDLLRMLAKWDRDDVADVVTRRIEDELRESEYAEFDRIHAYDRWDADFEGGCC
jgi:hypothetical protein